MAQVYAVTRCKDEVDIVKESMRRILTHVDHVIIGDGSSDGSWDVLEGLVAEGWPITLFRDEKLNVQQREVMTEYSHMAMECGAEFVVVFDVDECWHVPDSDQRIADYLLSLPPDVMIVEGMAHTHWATALDDMTNPDPLTRMGWRDVEEGPMPKVACRTRPDLFIEHGNHAAYYLRSPHPPKTIRTLKFRHYPYRSPEQFIKRVEGAWPSLAASGLPEEHGRHTRIYGRHLDAHGPEGLREWFYDQMYHKDPGMDPGLVFDPYPDLASV